MNGKLKKNIGFSLIFFSFFFLFEPSYALIDPLPDSIGYLILCLSIINLADINNKILSSLRHFKKAFFISIARSASILLLQTQFIGDEQSVGILLFAFIFSVADFIIIIPAYRDLFEGLLSLGIFSFGETVHEKKRPNGKNYTEKINILTVAFIIVKNILWLLPELTTLQANSSYEFIVIVRILSIIFLMPFSLIWLISIQKYFTRVKKDSLFVDELSKKYLDKKASSQNVFLCRTLCMGITIVMISSFLSFDIYSENINILPDATAYIILMVSAIMLKSYSKKWKMIMILSPFGIILSGLLHYSEIRFFELHTIASVQRDYEAYIDFHIMLGISVISAIIFIAVMMIEILSIRDIFLSHASERRISTDDYPLEYKRKFSVYMWFGIISLIISEASSVYRIFSYLQFNWSWIYYYSGIISSCLSIIFIALSCAYVIFVKNEIRYNYALIE